MNKKQKKEVANLIELFIFEGLDGIDDFVIEQADINPILKPLRDDDDYDSEINQEILDVLKKLKKAFKEIKKGAI